MSYGPSTNYFRINNNGQNNSITLTPINTASLGTSSVGKQWSNLFSTSGTISNITTTNLSLTGLATSVANNILYLNGSNVLTQYSTIPTSLLSTFPVNHFILTDSTGHLSTNDAFTYSGAFVTLGNATSQGTHTFQVGNSSAQVLIVSNQNTQSFISFNNTGMFGFDQTTGSGQFIFDRPIVETYTGSSPNSFSAISHLFGNTGLLGGVVTIEIQATLNVGNGTSSTNPNIINIGPNSTGLGRLVLGSAADTVTNLGAVVLDAGTTATGSTSNFYGSTSGGVATFNVGDPTQTVYISLISSGTNPSINLNGSIASINLGGSTSSNVATFNVGSNTGGNGGIYFISNSTTGPIWTMNAGTSPANFGTVAMGDSTGVGGIKLVGSSTNTGVSAIYLNPGSGGSYPGTISPRNVLSMLDVVNQRGPVLFTSTDATLGGQVDRNLYFCNYSTGTPAIFAPRSADVCDLGSNAFNWNTFYMAQQNASGTNVVRNNSTGAIRPSSSDEKIKKNIVPTDLGLDFINKIRPVKFQYKTQSDDENYEYGFIAQNINQATDNLGIPRNGMVPLINNGTEENDFYSVNHYQLLSPIFKAIQELLRENEQLENDLNNLTTLFANRNST